MRCMYTKRDEKFHVVFFFTNAKFTEITSYIQELNVFSVSEGPILALSIGKCLIY